MQAWVLPAVITAVFLVPQVEAGGNGAETDLPDEPERAAKSREVLEEQSASAWTKGDRIAVLRSDVLRVDILQTNWGWVETDARLEQLRAQYDRLRAYLTACKIELKHWSVSPDSLYGEVVRIEGDARALVPVREVSPPPSQLEPDVSSEAPALVTVPEESPPSAPPAPDVPSESTSGGTCFRAQACPKCDWIVLLEFSMASSPEHCGEGPFGSGDLGVLRNLSRNYGVGATFFYGGDDCGGRYGFRPRFRLWLAEQIGLDFGAGVALGDDSDDNFLQYPAFSGQVAFDIGGLVAPFYQVDMLRSSNHTNWDSFVGFRMESYAVPAAVLLLGILYGAAGD